MKIALVHDRIFPGGALNVFEDLIQEERNTFPKADFRVFTMIADREYNTLQGIEIVEALPKRITYIFTSFSGKGIPLLSTLFDYRNLMVFYP